MAAHEQEFDDEQREEEYLRDIIEEALSEKPQKIVQERHPMTRKSSERLQRLRKKISEDRNGEKFEDSTEMIRQMREERAQHLDDVASGRYNDAEK